MSLDRWREGEDLVRRLTSSGPRPQTLRLVADQELNFALRREAALFKHALQRPVDAVLSLGP